MNDRIKTMIKPFIYIAVFIFIICCLFTKPKTFDDYTSYVGYSISGACLFFALYERWIWKYIPWNRPPVLKKHYDGVLSYVYKKQPGTKAINITVKQTWLSVEIETKTDINASSTVTGTFVKEHGCYVLYYTYITNPSAVYQGKNPIQYGTCRMVLNDNNEKIIGKYWTSSQTIGDMEWKSITESRS